MKKLFAATAVGVGLMIAAPGVAHAQGNPVCSFLDEYPSVAGVEELVLAAVDEGMDAGRAGEVIADAVMEGCPEHMDILGMFIQKWA